MCQSPVSFCILQRQGDTSHLLSLFSRGRIGAKASSELRNTVAGTPEIVHLGHPRVGNTIGLVRLGVPGHNSCAVCKSLIMIYEKKNPCKMYLQPPLALGSPITVI